MRALAGVALAIVVVLAGVAMLFREATKARCWSWGAPTVCRVETEAKLVALTFDDGPTGAGVDSVLPALERHGAKATFFLIGSEMERRPGLAKRLADAGHEIGNHSFSHRHLVDLRSGGIEAEVRRTDHVLREQGVRPSHWFRPPYGQKFVGLASAAERTGKQIAMWNVEEPSAEKGAQAYAEALLSQVRPGSVILIHPMVSSRRVEREALPLVLAGLEMRGFRAVTLSELAGK